MKYIGIDLGSSFLKAVLIDLDNEKITDSNHIPSPARFSTDNPNFFEVPAEQYIQQIRALIDKYTSVYNDIEGVVISTQMHGFVYSVPDRTDMYISWQDMRCLDVASVTSAKTYLDLMMEMVSPEEMVDSGVYMKPSLGICNLYTLLREEADIPKNGTLYTLGSYVIHALTGNNTAHISNAAPVGFADVHHHCTDEKLLARLGLDHVKLPAIAEDDFEICGEFLSNGCKLRIHPDYGDMQIAILGCEIGEGDVVVNIATGAQVICFSSDFRPGKYEIRPFFEGGFLNTISNMPSGRNLAVLISFLRECVEMITGNNVTDQDVWEAVHALPYVRNQSISVDVNFYKNPHFLNGGSISGITQNNFHPETLFAAAYHNMAETYKRFIDDFDKADEEIRRIICAGGVSWKTPVLCKEIGKVTGKTCILSPMQDEAMAGMVKLALVCSGKSTSLSQCGRRSADG